MSISFESAVETLKTMFPDWDEDTLSTILVSNNYHVERTIETVLSMGGGDDSAAPASSSTPQAAPAPTAAPRAAPAPAPSDARYRGLRCTLPPDFLQAPGPRPNDGNILADEELALMLQNEMFQSQARELLGEDFMRNDYGGGGVGGERGARGMGQPRRQEPADMGIMKAISSMGAAAKKNLTQLAETFKTSNSGSGTRSGSGSGSNSRRGSGSGMVARNAELDDSEEGTEIITFGGGARGRHVLDGEEEDYDPFESENPLLAHRDPAAKRTGI